MTSMPPDCCCCSVPRPACMHHALLAICVPCDVIMDAVSFRGKTKTCTVESPNIAMQASLQLSIMSSL